MRAREVITRAFSEVVTSRMEISEAELIDGKRYLNRMMAGFLNRGIDVGFQKINDIDEEVTVPTGVLLGIIKNLAKTLWPQYSTEPLNQIISRSANRTFKTMQNYSINIDQAAQFSANVPVGSGNPSYAYSNSFYTNDPGVGEYIAIEE